MSRRIAAFGISIGIGITIFASPAAAHQGHRSCGEGARTFIVPLAQSGQGGETASAQAKAGVLNESVQAAHAALCEPAP